MSAGDIYVKTPLGVQEISNKKLHLPHRLRCMLILIDGVQPEFLLKEEGRKLSAPEDFFEQLTALELIVKREAIGASSAAGDAVIAAAPGEPKVNGEFEYFRAAKDFMNTTIVDAAGIKSFFFTLKLERASTRADLQDLLPDYTKAMNKSAGEDVARVMLDRIEKMLAQA